jgi:hypothetical protein
MLGHRLQTLTPTTAAAPAATTAAAPVVTVTASALKYIVDPMQEDTFVGARMPGLERDSLTEAVQSLITGSTVSGISQPAIWCCRGSARSVFGCTMNYCVSIRNTPIYFS